MSRETTLHEVSAVLIRTLALDVSRGPLVAETGLFGSMPELDSLAVLELVQALEDDLGVRIDDEDFSGDAFETVGALAALVERLRSPTVAV